MHPQEIRNREFTRSIRGYNTTEVDEYIDFLADAVSLLQRENNELERKLTIAIKKLEELQEREASITRLDTEMRRAAARLLHQAENQRDHILADARAEADRILQDTQAKAAHQKKLCAAMQKEIAQFKDELYNRYGQHIDQLEKIAQATARMSFGEAAETAPASAVPEAIVNESPVAELEEVPMIEEIDGFEDAPAVEEVEEFEDAPAAEEVEEFDDAPAVEEVEEFEYAPTVEDIEEFDDAPAVEEVEEFEDAPAVEEVEEFEDAPAVEEVEEFEDAPAKEEIEQLNLFEAEDDTDDIHREIAAIIGGDALFTDYTDTISEDTLDTGYTLILPTDTDPVPAEEMPRQADANEDAPAATEEDAGEVAEEDGDTEEDDALLLQNLRRAFSVEFETFDSKKSAKKPSEEEDFSFVENEAPKKRGFLSRLIGGDSDN